MSQVESAAVGPQLLRPGYCQEKQSAVDGTGTGGLFPRVPLQLEASGQCVGRRDGAGKTKEGVGKAARERGGKRAEEAGECSPHDQSAHPHPGCAPCILPPGSAFDFLSFSFFNLCFCVFDSLPTEELCPLPRWVPVSPLPMLLAEHVGLPGFVACWALSVVATWGRVFSGWKPRLIA